MARLTDKALAQSTAITPTTLVHIVTTGDTTQNAAGSSYKVELNQLATTFGGFQYYSAITVSSPELLSLNTSPVTILPATASNQYYDFKIYLEYSYNTVAYDSLNSLCVVDDYLTQIVGGMDCTNPNDVVRVSYGLSNTSIPGTSLTLYNSTDSTFGDGTVNVKIYYNIITFG